VLTSLVSSMGLMGVGGKFLWLPLLVLLLLVLLGEGDGVPDDKDEASSLSLLRFGVFSFDLEGE
jgi:hypothetical protein